MLSRLRAACDSPSLLPALGLGLMLSLNVSPHVSGGRTCLHFLVALAVTLAAVGLLYRVRPQGTPAFAWAPAAAAVLACADPLSNALGLRFVGHIVCAVASGAGMAYLYCRWFALFRVLPLSGALKQLTLAFSLSALIRVGLTLAARAPFALPNILLMAVALGQVAVLYAAQRALVPQGSLSERLVALSAGSTDRAAFAAPADRDRGHRLRAYGLVALELGVYGILFGLLRTDVLGWSFTTNSRLPGQLTQIVVPLLLFGWLTASAGRRRAPVRGALLATVAIVLAAVLFADAVEPTLSVVMFALRCLISLVIYVRLFEVCYRFGDHPCVVWGLGRSWFGLAFIGGLVLYDASLVRSAMDSLPLNAIFFCMACVILLLLNSFSSTAAFSRQMPAAADGAPGAAEGEGLTLREQCARAAERFGLSERESEVLYLTCTGLSKREAAERLCISEDTVRYHTKQLYRKLGVHNHQELMLAVLAPTQK